jgi:hypothetical protein
MLQEIIIKSHAEESIKPLIESAIQNQLKTLQHSIKRTKEKISGFEKKLELSSTEFEKRLNSGEIEETLETMDWNMEIVALRLLETQYQSLSEAKID